MKYVWTFFSPPLPPSQFAPEGGGSDIFQREIIQGFLSWWTLELKRLKARKDIGSKWFLLPIWETCGGKIMAHNIQR